MTVASSLFEAVELKEELSFGVKDTDTDNAQLLSRVEFTPKFDQSIVESNEIKSSMQTENYARGIKAVSATLKTEAKSGAYKPLWAALLRQNFNTGVVDDITGTDISCVAPVNNLTTSGSDWTTAGQLDLAVGDTIKFTGFTGGNKGNNNRLWILLASAAGTMKLRAKSGNYVMLADAAGENVTVWNLGTTDSPKTNAITRATIAAVADTSIFQTVGGDFTVPFDVGNIVKVNGFTGGNVANDDKPFKITKLTATDIFGYYTDGTLPVSDAATESVTITKSDLVKLTYNTENDLAVATTTRLTSSSSFIAEGFKVHDVIRLVGFPTSTNNNRNLLITSFNTAGTQLNFKVLDDDATTVPIVVESAEANDYVYRVGSKSFIPQANHTNKSFMIEKWQSDIAQSEQYTGLRVNMAKVTVPNSGIPTVDFDFLGKDIETAQAHYYTSSNEPTESQNLDSIFGRVYVNAGVDAGCVTSFSISVSANLSALDKCVGGDVAHDIVAGVYKISGDMSIYFEDEVMRDHFLDKDEMSMVFIIKESNAYNADFLAFQMPRMVYNSSSNSGGTKQLLTIPFTAMQNPIGDDGTDANKLKSSFSIQDSIA